MTNHLPKQNLSLFQPSSEVVGFPTQNTCETRCPFAAGLLQAHIYLPFLAYGRTHRLPSQFEGLLISEMISIDTSWAAHDN